MSNYKNSNKNLIVNLQLISLFLTVFRINDIHKLNDKHDVLFDLETQFDISYMQMYSLAAQNYLLNLNNSVLSMITCDESKMLTRSIFENQNVNNFICGIILYLNNLSQKYGVSDNFKLHTYTKPIKRGRNKISTIQISNAITYIQSFVNYFLLNVSNIYFYHNLVPNLFNNYAPSVYFTVLNIDTILQTYIYDITNDLNISNPTNPTHKQQSKYRVFKQLPLIKYDNETKPIQIKMTMTNIFNTYYDIIKTNTKITNNHQIQKIQNNKNLDRNKLSILINKSQYFNYVYLLAIINYN